MATHATVTPGPYWHCMPLVPVDPSDTMAQQHLAALHAQLAAAAGRMAIADDVAELCASVG